jgi:predicted phage tail protein|tara:strand:- start:314 stop:595 length:282 start_codon:yes stop_codon:yes gene_type:complete
MIFSYPTNITGMGQVMVYANSITGGYFGTTMTAVFFGVMFFLIGADDKALITAGFTTLLISLMMNIMGIVDSSMIMIYLALTLVGMVWNWTKN